ncbi:hypothetical protein ABPG72_013465 [Tetrahymena utriculariae]
MIAKQHLSVAVFGDVDSGKSTTCGHLVFKLGEVDQRKIDELKALAEKEGKSSFGFAYVMDRTKAERSRGITIDVTMLKFNTTKYNYTIIDTPGHKDFVKNMITGTAQADVGILIVTAEKGGFEAGFCQGGQTKEHVLLAYTLGLRQIIVCVNKMDDKLVNFSEERFENIKSEVSLYLSKVGFNLKNVQFIPISGYHGHNLTEKSDSMSWYKGNTVLEALDSVTPPIRPVEKDLRIPVQGIYKVDGIGIVVSGRVESGVLQTNKSICFAPFEGKNKAKLEVRSIEAHHTKLSEGMPGDNIGFNVKNLEYKDISKGAVCGYVGERAPRECESFEAQVIVINHPGSIKKGYCPVVNVHQASVSCEFEEIMKKVDRKTGASIEENPSFIKNGECAIVKLKPRKAVCVETFVNNAPLGRFIIRDMKVVVAIGIIKSVNYK